MRSRQIILAAAAMLAAAAALGAEPTRWLNVHVNAIEDRTEVELHLPFQLVATTLESVHGHGLEDGKVALCNTHVDVDWPAILAEVRRAPEGEYVKVRESDGNVVVTKRGGIVLVTVDETGAEATHVEVRLPEQLLDAIVVDEHDRLDLKALVGALERFGAGELVRVTAPDANVRIWVE
jgi:predicted lipoprotein with Yx(FWY)xxD motif